MIRNHARLILALSVFLLSFVALDFVTLSKNYEEQHKTTKPKENIDLVQAVNQIGQVLGGEPKYYIKIKDKTTGTYVTGASLSLVCSDWTGVDYFYYDTSSNYYYASTTLCSDSSSPTLAISKTGYKTQSGLTLSDSGEQTSPKVVLLEPNTTPTTTKKTTTKTTTKVETIKDVSLPEEFKEEGTVSTDLSKISDTTKVSDLTLDSSKNKIKFNEIIDLSATDTKDKFKQLNSYVKVDKVGVVSIDSTSLPALNKKATITMKKLPYIKTPKVLVNGKVDDRVVSNILYKDGNLTFDVTHFSTFAAAPTVGITEPANNLETNENPITLRGTVSDPTASVSAKLNNKDIGKLKVATVSGTFEKQVTLSEGVNKIVVTAISANGSKAVATVSATLLKAAVLINLIPYFIIAGLLAFIAALSFIYALRAIKKHHNPKKPGGPAAPVPSTLPSEQVPNANLPKSTGPAPWENTPTPKVS